MAEDPHPLVSIVMPTYNEERDIGLTMQALAALAYRPLEVIVVDASRDRTPEIVQSFSGKVPGLQLIPQGDRPGVSAARNAGLKAARGEIVVILNADVLPPPDFVDRIMVHYRAGADYVLVDSEVINTESLFPRYLQAQHLYNLQFTRDQLQWTEGFSCRRAAALAAGGFPEEFAANTAGEDAIFGGRLAEHFRRVADFSIVVPHVMPGEFAVYWRQRLGRGRGGAYVLYVQERRPLRWGAVARSTLGTLALTALVIPAVIYAARLVGYSERGLRDLVPFTWSRLIEMAATAIGYWDGCREILRQRRIARARSGEAA